MRSLTAMLLCALASAPNFADGAGDAVAGKAKAGACAACHGADGNSTNPDWPKLAGQHAAYLAKQVRDLKAGKTRNNAMMTPMVAGLSDQDIEDISAYFASRESSGGFTSEARVALGEKIYRGGNASAGTPACIACHGPRGAGNALAGFPSLSGQHAKYVAKQLNDWRSGARTNDRGGMMRDTVRFLFPDEIAAVAEYVSGLH